MGNRLARFGITVMAAAELIGCGGPGNHETTPRSGETVERTDAGIKITVEKPRYVTKRKVYNICGGSVKALRQSKKFDCPELVKDIHRNPKNRREKCITCAREVTVQN